MAETNTQGGAAQCNNTPYSKATPFSAVQNIAQRAGTKPDSGFDIIESAG